jgi:hypothetical protein
MRKQTRPPPSGRLLTNGKINMFDVMMSRSERERFNKHRQEARANARVRNSAIAVSLAFSKTLRRLWMWVTLAVIGLASLILFLEANMAIPRDSDLMKLVNLGIVFILPFWILWAVGLWCDAHIIRWVARKAQRDYRDCELFNR